MRKNILHTVDTFRQGRQYLFMEHFEYNGHKFRYVIEFANYDPLEQKVQIMRADGTWENIVGAHSLGISVGGVVVHSTIEECRSNAKDICEGFDAYIKAVY